MRVASAVLALAACGARPLPVDDELPPEERLAAPDDEKPEAPGQDRPNLYACFTEGAGDPGGVRDLTWQIKVGECESSACWDFLHLDADCLLTFQHNNQPRTAQVSAPDCRAARNSVSTPFFLEAVGPLGCAVNAKLQVNEIFEVEGRTPVRRKLSACGLSSIIAARNCLEAVRLRVLP